MLTGLNQLHIYCHFGRKDLKVIVEIENSVKEYFENLGFTMTDMHNKKQACDFIMGLEYEGELYTVKVEVKGNHETCHPNQIEMLKQGGLIVYVSRKTLKVGEIKITEDLIDTHSTFQTIEHVTPIWKA